MENSPTPRITTYLLPHGYSAARQGLYLSSEMPFAMSLFAPCEPGWLQRLQNQPVAHKRSHIFRRIGWTHCVEIVHLPPITRKNWLSMSQGHVVGCPSAFSATGLYVFKNPLQGLQVGVMQLYTPCSQGIAAFHAQKRVVIVSDLSGNVPARKPLSTYFFCHRHQLV